MQLAVTVVTGCLPLFFFGFCEQSQILTGIAKSRIWRVILSFCALILFEPFSLLFGILGSTCAKWYFVPTPEWSMVAVRWQRDGGGKCGGSAAAARRRQLCWGSSGGGSSGGGGGGGSGSGAALAIKTPAATGMAVEQTTTNNQLIVAVATATETM